MEPATPYAHGWHLDAIADHLEAVTRGEIRQLLINVPPRHTKSLTVSVFWPSWVWTFAPATRWLFTSYIENLAVRDNVKARRVMTSPWYVGHWGQVFQFTSDQNVKTRYENDRTGYRVATGVGGGATGEGGDILVADDPHNVKQAESQPVREAVLTWWDEVMSSRLNDPRTGAKVIIMQRVHERDLAGHVLAQGGYEHLCLPAEYDGRRCVTVLGDVEQRTDMHALLWPDRFPRTALDALKLQLGPYGAAGQLQQRPAPRSGGLFERHWFEIVGEAPREARRGRYWDKAGTAGGGAFTAGVRMSHVNGLTYIEDVVRGQWAAGDREAQIKATTQADAAVFGPTGFTVWVEQEPGSGGKESAGATIQHLAGYRVYADRPTGDKFTRADPLAAAAKAGNVKLVRGAWNEAFLRELEAAGPGAAFLDQMDAAAGAFNLLTLGPVTSIGGFPFTL